MPGVTHTPSRHCCFCLQDLFLEWENIFFLSSPISLNLHQHVTHSAVPSSPLRSVTSAVSLPSPAFCAPVRNKFINGLQLGIARLLVATATLLLILWCGQEKERRKGKQRKTEKEWKICSGVSVSIMCFTS